MANELTLGDSLAFSKDGKQVNAGKQGVKVTVTGGDFISATQTVGITEEALNIGDITTLGHAFFQNLDDTNFVEIRPATGAADLITLKPGETCRFRFSATVTAPFVIADTAPVEIAYTIIED